MIFSTACRSLFFIFVVLVVHPLGGCKEYPYASPSPGVLEVRMKTVSANIPYGDLNRLPMQLTAVRAVRSDNAKQDVFEDLRAIRRYTDSYDAFSRAAFDSTLEIGQTYTPPGSYVGLDITTQPLGIVILDGYRTIPITYAADAESFIQLRTPITVEEGKTTIVVVSFDVDSSLVRGAETFHYNPTFFISSLQIQ